jgi:hypothetical protein
MTGRHHGKWYLRSKTLHVNALAAVLAALEAQWQLLSPYMPEHWHAWALVGLAMVNAYLRVITTQPVSWRRDGVYYERGHG